MSEFILIIIVGYIIGRILWQPFRRIMILNKMETMEDCDFPKENK